MRKSIFALIAACGAAGVAQATTFSSFLPVSSISGITVTPVGNSYTVTLSAGATFTYNSVNYNVSRIIGFYLLAPGFDDGGQAALPNTSGFSDDSDHKPAGSAYGWRSNPNNGIELTEDNPLTFTFPSAPNAAYIGYGFHIFLSDGLFPNTTGNTGNITLLPTPGSAALLGAGMLAASRRRRV